MMENYSILDLVLFDKTCTYRKHILWEKSYFQYLTVILLEVGCVNILGILV